MAPVDSNVRSSLPGLGPEASEGRRLGVIDQFYQWCLIMQQVPLELLSPMAVFLAAFSVAPMVEH